METKKKVVSFSQLSMYRGCNYRWYLSYVKGLSSREAGIHLIFGSAMHSTLQSYLKEMYEHSVKQADILDINSMLQENMTKEFISSRSGLDDGKYPCTKEEMKEFYLDGVAILDFFKKHRDEYFSKKGFELVGIEVPLSTDLQNNVTFRGYIDVVVADTIANKYKIIDFKTSTNGWRDYQKKDFTKTSQIVLYKKFYSEKFDVETKDVGVEFIILKRKLYENSDYPQKRIQRFVPPSGTPTINQVTSMLNEFVNNCFTLNGEYNINRKYLKADDEKQCRFCEYSNNPSLCDKKN